VIVKTRLKHIKVGYLINFSFDFYSTTILLHDFTSKYYLDSIAVSYAKLCKRDGLEVPVEHADLCEQFYGS